MSEHVRIGREGRVMTIVFNRPDRKNALTHEMYAAIADALETAQTDDSVRAVVFTGEGDMFTAGNDLGEFAAGMPEGKPPVNRFLEGIREAEKPLIAAVNGPSVGVGLTMLLHCDLTFASEAATFRAPFAQIGLVPEAASSLLLPLSLGNAWANDVLLAGRTLTAQDALMAGLASRVYAPDQLWPETMKVATEIAALAPNAVKASKRLIRSTRREAVAKHMGVESEIFAAQLKSAEFAEAARAFMEKRAPVFD